MRLESIEQNALMLCRARVRARAACERERAQRARTAMLLLLALPCLAPILRMVFAKSFFTAAAGRGYHRRAKLENFLSGRTKKRT